jgi:trk system potassium uptake protein TrkA
MHLIVVGCGRVGCLLAQQMVAEGHSVAVIDKNPQAFKRLGVNFASKRCSASGLIANAA